MQISKLGRRLDLNHHVHDSRQAVEATRCLCHCNCFESASARARRKPPIDHRVLARPWFGAANVRPRSLSRAERSAALDLAPPPASAAEDGTAERTIEISASSVDVNAAGDAVFSGEVEIKLPRGHDHGGERQLDGRRRRRRAWAASTSSAPTSRSSAKTRHYDEASETISFSSAGFDLPKRPARGSAEQIEVASDSRVSLTNALFTTCPPENVAWELSARDIELDVNGGVGTARGVKLDFKGVPILYAPYFTFPINDAAQERLPDARHQQARPHGLRSGRAVLLEPRAELRPDARAALHERARHTGAQRLPLSACRTAAAISASSTCPTTTRRNTTRRYANLQHESLFGGARSVGSAGRIRRSLRRCLFRGPRQQP